MPPYRPADVRFWEKVDRSAGNDSCWPWLAYCKRNGYGTFFPQRGKCVTAHRYMWLLTYGTYPGKYVLHTCDNPRCVNPRHLWEGTQRDNMHDMIAKGRHRPPPGRARTSPEGLEAASMLDV
jgi:hypothetical protein